MPKLIDLSEVLGRGPVPKQLVQAIGPALERLSGIAGVNRIYEEVHQRLDDLDHDSAFFMKTLRVMNLQFEVDTQDYERIPKEGPLLAVANHPYGGADGIILGALLRGVRSDAKIMGNYLLSNIDGIRGSIINVDPFGREDSKRANFEGIRESLKHLRAGNCLGVFPSGEVSSFNFRNKLVVDPEWSEHVTSLAIKADAPVLPVYFEGHNSGLFQALGLLHPSVRTFLLGREFSRMRDRSVKVRIGPIIEPGRLKKFENRKAATDFLRLKTYSQREIPTSAEKLRFPFRAASLNSRVEALAPPQDAQQLENEVRRLPVKQHLVEQGDFDVYYAKSNQIPVLLQEIGKLREETFREVQEGTGQSRDLDEFDEHYIHLFLWNRAEREVAGAYRIGLADEIAEQSGLAGLYTSTLFKFKPEFLEKLGPSLELGRSFVCLKYQKKHASLSLIWKGIGEFVALHPRYRILFGPVSITDAYNSISKNLMVHFFREHSFDDEMSKMVSARKPPKSKTILRGASLKNIAESITSVDSVSAIISGFEDDKKGIPILLRHYLKLNGVLLSFNVDPAFSDVIDGLILVDLIKAEPRLLERYFGKECYARIADHHASTKDNDDHEKRDII